MFGYIMPDVYELKVGEYEFIKAYYCGLCKKLKSKYHKTVILNYDCTFIYLLADSLQNGEIQISPCNCMLHPIQKRTAVYARGAEYAADINALMGWSKLVDDARDGSILAKLKQPFYRRLRTKAAAAQPEIYGKMQEMISALTRLETEGCADTDAAADPYAKLLGDVLSELDVVQSHILYNLGYALGRWVYLVDAFDDLEEDRKTGNYNVFLKKYGAGVTKDALKQDVQFSFNFTLAKAAEALQQLELKKNREILKNILCLGLRRQTERVFEGMANESIRCAGR
jgi:hypothetical protein